MKISYAVTLPDELEQKLLDHMEAEGKSAAEVLRIALAKFFKTAPPAVQHGGARPGAGRPSRKQ
jgi:hypothetical protein